MLEALQSLEYILAALIGGGVSSYFTYRATVYRSKQEFDVKQREIEQSRKKDELDFYVTLINDMDKRLENFRNERALEREMLESKINYLESMVNDLTQQIEDYKKRLNESEKDKTSDNIRRVRSNRASKKP